MKEFKLNRKTELYNEYKKSTKITEVISKHKKDADSLNKQIQELQVRLDLVKQDISILEEIRDSQKTFILIDKELKRLGLSHDKLFKNDYVTPMLNRYKYKDIEEMY